MEIKLLLQNSLQQEIPVLILLVSYNNKRCWYHPITNNIPDDAPQPMAHIQIYQLYSKHCILGILNWFLSYSTTGLLQHFSNSVLHWQELMYQSKTENSKIWPFWKSQAPTFKMYYQCSSLQGTAPFSYAFIRKALAGLKPKLRSCKISSSYIRMIKP